jgi:hypothetical protein
MIETMKSRGISHDPIPVIEQQKKQQERLLRRKQQEEEDGLCALNLYRHTE